MFSFFSSKIPIPMEFIYKPYIKQSEVFYKANIHIYIYIVIFIKIIIIIIIELHWKSLNR